MTKKIKLNSFLNILMKHIFLLFIILNFLTCNTFNNKIAKISINDRSELFKMIVNIYNINYTENDGIITITNDKNTVQNILKAITLLSEYRAITIDNILNKDLTKKDNGEVYRKKNIQIFEDGTYKIVVDYETPLRIVYDPTHPDAIKSGPKIGYVEYPNIDIKTEYIYLSMIETELQLFYNILKHFDSNIIIPNTKIEPFFK